MSNDNKPKSRDSRRWMVFFIISLIYFFVYFHRVSTSVLASDILKAFDVNATALGFMSSMYFYLYAFEQPFVGYLTDRLGARRVIAYFTFAAAAGSFMFALAPGIIWASAGRALIGIGVGGVFVPAVKSFSQWFRKNEFATTMGLLMAVGNFGAVVATTPLAWAANSWGWRICFHVIGWISLALAIGSLFFMSDFNESDLKTEDEHVPLQDEKVSGKIPFYSALASFQFWIMAVVFFGVYGIVMTFQGLWATPYLIAVLETDRIAASRLNMLIPLGFIVGAPLFGRLSDRIFKSRVQIIIRLLAVLTLSWAGILFGMKLGILPVCLILFCMGITTGGFVSMLWSHIRETIPARILGSVSGLLNPSPFLGVALFQILTGALLDRGRLVEGAYPPEAYKSSFVLCFIVSFACFALSFFLKEQNSGEKQTRQF
ncbi:MAG: MFS transporter [Desulfobacteraceae bacterium]|nr:MAG: MFS transporter [Desulfobacteraceae bacterium]